jgi:hypothetical protein
MGGLQVAVLLVLVLGAVAWKVRRARLVHRLLILFFLRRRLFCDSSLSQIPPPQGKVTSAQAANATSTSSLVVQTLQASAEFSIEAHNGIGWTSVYISQGTNAFCSLSYTQYWGQTTVTQTGCMVLYNPGSNQYFLQAYSGLGGSSSWCKARCLLWS